MDRDVAASVLASTEVRPSAMSNLIWSNSSGPGEVLVICSISDELQPGTHLHFEMRDLSLRREQAYGRAGAVALGLRASVMSTARPYAP